MPADLILYALVAAGLVFWLRSVLGTRHGEERERPSPFLSGEEAEAPVQDKEPKNHDGALNPAEQIAALAAKPTKNHEIDNKTAEGGLLAIAEADRDFDVEAFLEAAQDAFVMIVESFADGDKEILKDLLAEDVYNAFEGAIIERENKGETQITEIHAIRKANIVFAELQGRSARVTVKFTAEESSVTKDKDGEIIAGHPDKTTTMHDIWTFGRDVKSKDPSWLLMETRGDFEDDNDLIPDTVK